MLWKHWCTASTPAHALRSCAWAITGKRRSSLWPWKHSTPPREHCCGLTWGVPPMRWWSWIPPSGSTMPELHFLLSQVNGGGVEGWGLFLNENLSSLFLNSKLRYTSLLASWHSTHGWSSCCSAPPPVFSPAPDLDFFFDFWNIQYIWKDYQFICCNKHLSNDVYRKCTCCNHNVFNNRTLFLACTLKLW